jgi:hypothetical protein
VDFHLFNVEHIRANHVVLQQAMSFNRWGAEALYSESLTWYQGVYDLDQSAAQFGYTLYRTGFDLLIMIVCGVILRGIAFLLLIGLNRDRQR